jgi:hypothetical protein
MRNQPRSLDVPPAMRDESVTVAAPTGLDWKAEAERR